MAHVNLPKTSQTGANEWADVEDNDQAIVDEVIGGLDNTNIDASAAIAYSKLASMSTGAVLLGNAGTPTATTLTNLTLGATGAVTGITASALGSDSVTTAKILNENVTGAKLADDIVGVYRTLMEGTLEYAGSTSTVQIYTPSVDVGVANPPSVTDGIGMIYLAAADYAISGRTTFLRMRAQQLTAGTAPASTIQVRLHPVSSLSAGSITLGSVTTGSEVDFVSTAANTRAQDNSGDFAFPADGYYAIAVDSDVATAAASAHTITFQLQLHHT
jgi:hypothetical protein